MKTLCLKVPRRKDDYGGIDTIISRLARVPGLVCATTGQLFIRRQAWENDVQTRNLHPKNLKLPYLRSDFRLLTSDIRQ